jgi:multiple sugar transport system permease protein
VSDAGAAVVTAGTVRDGTLARLRRRRDVLLLLGPCVVYLIAFSVYPLVRSFYVSLQHYNGGTGKFEWVGFHNYTQLFSDPVFWDATKTTAWMVGAAVVLQLLTGTALALFFNLHLRGSWIVRGILILPMLLTPVVVGLMWRALLNPDWGMIDWISQQIGLPDVDWLGDPGKAIWTLILVDTWQWTPFVFVVVFARLQTLPLDVFEAAEVDGATWLQRLRYVTLPLLLPAILFAGIFRAIDAFRSFDLVFGLTYGGPVRITTTLSFYSFQNGFQFQNYGYASAISYVMVVMAIVGVTLLLRFAPVRRRETA